MIRVAAVDQGTTSTRGFVLDGEGKKTLVCTRQHHQFYPRSGWVEHDPEELFRHVFECVEAAGQIEIVSIDNQGESCMAWNAETGAAISPVIVWQDRRTEQAVSRLKSQGAEEIILSRSGLPLDPYFSASKLAWILANIPEASRLLKKGKLRLGTTDAFFIERLTGNYVTDITTASRTSLLNLETGQWDPELCRLFGIPIEILPEIRPTMSDFGAIHLHNRHVRLTASVVDQQASLYGHGCREKGDAKITFGTGAFVLALTGNIIVRSPQNSILPTVAWQVDGEKPVYAIDGGVYCAASALNWAKSLGLFSDFSQVNQFDAVSAVSRGLVFVPALTGLGSPFWDGSAAGLWIGMSLDTTAKDLVQAILEGIAFRTSQVFDSMNTLVSIGNSISIDGGLSVNPWFCQFLADVLQKKIIVQSSGEITAYGTALMANRNSGDIERNGSDVVVYLPETSQDEGKKRFEEAVLRSQGWREGLAF